LFKAIAVLSCLVSINILEKLNSCSSAKAIPLSAHTALALTAGRYPLQSGLKKNGIVPLGWVAESSKGEGRYPNVIKLRTLWCWWGHQQRVDAEVDVPTNLLTK